MIISVKLDKPNLWMVDCCNPFCFLLLLQSQPPATPLCSYLKKHINTKITMIIRSTFLKRLYIWDDVRMRYKVDHYHDWSSWNVKTFVWFDTLFVMLADDDDWQQTDRQDKLYKWKDDHWWWWCSCGVVSKLLLLFYYISTWRRIIRLHDLSRKQAGSILIWLAD